MIRRSDDFRERAPSLQQVLHWDDTDHFTVLTQLNGSVWPRVWPFCVVNILITAFVYYLNESWGIQLLSASTGHRYMAMVMSFLVVTRVKIIYDNYMQQSTALTECYHACRELVQTACLLTAHDPEGQQWRHDVAAATLHLLAVTMQVLEFRSYMYTEPRPTELPELLRMDSLCTGRALAPNDNPASKNSPRNIESQELFRRKSASAMELVEEACRAPLVLAWELRRVIARRRSVFSSKDIFQHPCNEELRMQDIVAIYLKEFAVLQKFMTTPLPFPLVQMTKTFLFVWIFTLPFVLNVKSGSMLAMTMLLVGLITYGFMGLEFVAMELSDCFGDDPSDLDNIGQAQQCYEDCYIAIFKVDGLEWTQTLRATVDRQSTFGASHGRE